MSIGALLNWVYALSLGDWLGVLGVLFGIVGLAYAWVTNQQKKELTQLNARLETQQNELKGLNNRLWMQLKTITLDDIQIFAEDVTNHFKGWRPDVIYCPDLRGGFVAFFVAKQMNLQVPILTGYIFQKDQPIPNVNIDNYYQDLSTPRYHIMLEKYIFKYAAKTVLIIDEIAVTGEAIHAIKQVLIDNNFAENAIKSCVVIASLAAEKSGRKPDFAWRTVEGSDVVFPWGRWD